MTRAQRAETRRVWYDTEFVCRGGNVDLISIGMVDNSGRELYEVCSEFDRAEAESDPWIAANVLTRLDKPEDEWLSRADLRDRVSEYLRGDDRLPGWRPVELWAWYASHDFVALSGLFGSFSEHPAWLPMYTMDVKQAYVSAGVDGRLPVPSNRREHNALHDAYDCKMLHSALDDYLARGSAQ